MIEFEEIVNNSLCNYDASFALKGIGYDKKCLFAYRNTDGEQELLKYHPNLWWNGAIHDTHDGFCAAPTILDAIKWLRDNYKFHIEPLWYGEYFKFKLNHTYAVILWSDTFENETTGYNTTIIKACNILKEKIKL